MFKFFKRQKRFGARTESYWAPRLGSYIETVKSTGYNILVNGINKYINFNSLSGESGYGIRDNGGTMQYKDNEGSWSDLSSIGGASQLSDLSDVGVTTPTNQNALMADGDSWESRVLVEADISDFGSYIETETDPIVGAINGIVKADGAGNISVAVADTDYASALGVDDNYVTDAEKIVIGNTSGTNTGDQVAGDFNHDDLANIPANDHIDWTADQGATNINNANITGLLHGTEVDNPSSGVHGATGTIVGTSDTQTLTNKTIDGDDNTLQDIAVASTKLTAGTALTLSTDTINVDIASSAEINTGTENAKAITPDAIAGANIGIRYVQIVAIEYTTDVATGDGKAYFHIPAGLDGMNLVEVHAEVITAGITGTTDIQIYNLTQTADMLSTKITIDSGETGSDTAATPAVIDTNNDDIAINDVIRIDVDAVSTTDPKGLIITMGFQLP